MRHRFALILCLAAAACGSPSGGGDDDGADDDGGGDGGGDGPSTSCTGDPGAAAQPFGNHGQHYASGVILPDHVSQDDLDGAVRGFYNYWSAAYLKSGCGSGHYYVDIGIDEAMTVSEAHGYGMVILAYMAGYDDEAKTRFDGMFHYYQEHLSEIEPTLMAWSQDDACHNNQGANSATDGDLDIAYALLLADKQWGSGGDIDYKAEAAKIIGGIKHGDVDSTGSYLRLGDWATPDDAAFYNSTRSSDFMPQHIASFAVATGDTTWTQVADTEYGIMDSLQTGFASQSGLLPDFITSPLSEPRPVSGTFLENQNDGKYAYNACRDPWRIATDFVINGDARAKTIAERLNAWIKSSTGGDPTKIRPGYNLDGTAIGPTYLDTAFVAPFGVAAMVDASNQQWLNDLWDTIAVTTNEQGYYQDSITMQTLLVMSGNWWSPEAAPCP